MVRLTDHPAMTIAVDLGHKATKQKNYCSLEDIDTKINTKCTSRSDNILMTNGRIYFSVKSCVVISVIS